MKEKFENINLYIEHNEKLCKTYGYGFTKEFEKDYNYSEQRKKFIDILNTRVILNTWFPLHQQLNTNINKLRNA